MPYKSRGKQLAYMRKRAPLYRVTTASERGTWTKILIELLGRKCTKCGSVKDLELDHIVPLYRGGKHEAANIQILCEDCHKKKTLEDRFGPLIMTIGRYPCTKCELRFETKADLGKHILQKHPYWVTEKGLDTVK